MAAAVAAAAGMPPTAPAAAGPTALPPRRVGHGPWRRADGRAGHPPATRAADGGGGRGGGDAAASAIAATAAAVWVPPSPALAGHVVLAGAPGAPAPGAGGGGDGVPPPPLPDLATGGVATPAATVVATGGATDTGGDGAAAAAAGGGADAAAAAAAADAATAPGGGGGAVDGAPAAAAALCKARGNSHFAAGRYADAVDAYTAGLRVEGGNVNLLSNRSAAHLKLGHLAAAEADGRAAVAADPQWPKGWWRVGVAQLEGGHPADAVATFDAALAACDAADANLRSARRRAVEAVEAAAHLAAVASEAGAVGGGAGAGAGGGGAVKRRYYALARALHPDKCRVAMGGEAMRDVAMAYTTLASPVKRALYDRYMRDVMAACADGPRAPAAGRSPTAAAPAPAAAAAAAAANRPTPSYSEWEASQAAAVDLPPWLVCLLGVHGGGCCVATALLLLLLPLAVVAGAMTVLAWAAWLPVRAVRRWRAGAEAAAEAERRAVAKADEGWQDAIYGHV
ncbi:hypothetical protein BU14_0178s0006 [Porphyra umbilicalis]|uniref:J domain-containing protein n=1 Tax=Porphyra umbilicalis TaxID=2786 RepID=A0A1X6P7G4_PORUM|nr:hypothetical protein BU14_0178s0006 [Porphyra umbilicalis]|eukprot:OSX76690.1 hypothetical protein BU14_0178s0006 [Porphyra umbilicalis]